MNKPGPFLNLLRQIVDHPNNRKAPLRAIARFIGWQFWKRFVRRPVIVRVGTNRRFLAVPDSPFSSLVIYTRLPEWDEMNFALRYLRADDRFLDLGANVGFYTVLGSSVITRGEIITVEPNPRNIAVLQQQLELNALETTRIVQSAIGDIDGTIHFDDATREMGSIIVGDSGQTKTRDLPCVRLDTLLSRMLEPDERIDLAKMDVEGCEMLILRGATETLQKRRIRTWLFEVSDPALKDHGSSAAELLGTFAAAGYSLFRWDESTRTLHPVADYVTLSSANLIACADAPFLHHRLGLNP